MDTKMSLLTFFWNDQCRKFGIPLWQCPHFLFFMMGLLIIGSILVAYGFGSRFLDDPLLINFIIFFLTVTLLIIAFIISRSFEQLAEASRLKSEFINIVSHQLRSPLTNLTWALDFLRTTPEAESIQKQASYMRILAANASRMQELVNDLLTVSRIQEGRLPLRRTKFSFTELINKTI